MALTKIPSSLLDTSGGINGLIYPTSDGTSGQFLKTDGSGNLTFATVTTYTDSDVETYLDGGSSTPTFASATVSGTLTVTGDLDITGDINSYNVTDLDVTDQTITLGAGQTEANSGGSGIIIDGSSASILWDETNDEWDFNKTINVLADSDIQAHIGRAKIGYMGFTDFAGFAHRDNALTGSYALLQYSTGETYLNAASGRDINIRINNSNVALFNSEGNFGIGTTSLTNNTLGKTTYFGNNTSTITGDSSQARFWLGNNWYYNSGDKFIDTGYANLYTQQSGTHQFLTSTTSGSAGQAATFTNVLTIDANGLVGIGTSSPLQKLVVSDGGGYGFEFAPNNSSVNQILSYDRSANVYRDFKISANEIRLGYGQAGANEAMRIDSLGNVGIGTSSPDTLLELRTDTNSSGYGSYPALTIRNDNTTGYGAIHFNEGSTQRARIEVGNNSGNPYILMNTGTSSGNGIYIDSAGEVGIGTTNPATKLHVYGTDPVIRVSDDGTTGYPALEFRQQNSGTEGTELMYDSGTGHTHLNTVYGADLKIATNTGSFGTTSTNTRLTVKSDGEIHVGKSGVSTDRIEFVGNVNISAPSTSNHDSGTRLTFYDTSANAFYAQGIESNHMWFNADDGGSYKFYTRAVQKVHIDCSAPMPEFRVGPTASNAMRLGSVTAVFPYSGPTLIVATPGAQLTVHNGTNSHTNWVTLNNSLDDDLRGTATFSTINTSQQANIIVYLNVATKVYMARQAGWNPVSTTGWTQISNSSTIISDNASHNVYVRYLPAGTHSLDNDSALYFFEAPIGP